jgi:hypothetical protein
MRKEYYVQNLCPLEIYQSDQPRLYLKPNPSEKVTGKTLIKRLRIHYFIKIILTLQDQNWNKLDSKQ